MPEVVTSGLSDPIKRLAHGGDRLEVGVDGALEVAAGHPVVLEGEVDDAVGVAGGLAQNVEVVERPALDRAARRFDGCGSFIRAGQAGDLVAGVEQLWDDGRTDVARRAGDEYTHGVLQGRGDDRT